MPGPASSPVSDRESYAAYLSANTGFDPRVIETWIAGEGNPGNLPGYYNYMNIQAATARYNHDPYVAIGPAGTAKFGSLSVGEQAALHEIRALGLSKEGGKSIAQQIADIAASPWASSHYGGPGGPNLVADFQHLYPGVAIGGAAQKSPYAGAGGGGIDLNPVDAVGGLLGHPLGTAEGLLVRGGMILAGTLVAIVGLYFIVRAFGIAPGPLEIANKIPGANFAKAAAGGSSTPRRQGDAAAARGEAVTRTGPPEAPTRSDKRTARRTSRTRQRAASDRVRARDEAFGGADDIPF